jgi:hypothetical protein
MLVERHVYSAKRALEELNSSIRIASAIDLPSGDELPDPDELKGELVQNIKLSDSSLTYVERLERMFPYLPELMDSLLDLKYKSEDSLDRLTNEVGCLLDFNKDGPIYYYFGKNYEKLNGPITEQIKINEYLTGSSGTKFSTAAQIFFYYRNKGVLSQFIRREDKTEGQLLGMVNSHYGSEKNTLKEVDRVIEIITIIQEVISNGRASAKQTTLFSDESEDVEFRGIKLTKVAQKLILLHELGVVDQLRKRVQRDVPNFSDAALSKILAAFMGDEINEETIRKGLSSYGHSGVRGNVKTMKAFNEVKSYLQRFGIKLDGI